MSSTLQSARANPVEGKPLLELEADLTEDGRYGARHVVVTSSHVTVREPGGAELSRVALADIETIKNEPLVSGGRLRVRTKSGEELTLASYSLTVAHRFSDLARGVEEILAGSELTIELPTIRTRCESCGRPLPEPDGFCPNCLNRGKTLLRVAAYLKPYKARTAVLVLLSMTSTGLNLVPPLIQRSLVDGFKDGTMTTPVLLQNVGLWGLLALGASTTQIFTGRTMAYLAAHISADLRNAVFRAVQGLGIRYFDRKPVGAIASRVTNDTERLWFFLVDGLPFFFINVLMFVGVIGFLFWTDVGLATAILIPIPLIGLVSMYFWKPLSIMFHKVSQKMARLHMHLNESLSGIRVVKAFVREDFEFGKFSVRNREWRDTAYAGERRWTTGFGIMTFFIALAALINWGYGGTMVIQGRLTLGEFVMVNSYLLLVYGPLQWFAQINNWFSRAMAGAERVFEVLDMAAESPDSSGTKIPLSGEVSFENVRFGYDKSNPVIKDMSFTVKAGEMIGLVGHSGSGKSTTINLIARFYEPDSGRILIDGLDYRELDLGEFRRQIGIVLQEPFLFNGTIAENIAYGKPDATFDEIVEAARAANAHDFVLAKQDGYDTVVGERGARLSGGERQRVSIARAILHDPKILILDEATSSVDVETERQIQEAIQNLIANRTTFAIAHRLTTLRTANRLIVLERGEIKEIGTHDELMAANGTFAKLVETQRQINQVVEIGNV
ncbi:MAG: ABC transporter transmembrane domain-containing protein [Fimbriimonadaceae bacterium]